jgi:hypothetical protein
MAMFQRIIKTKYAKTAQKDRKNLVQVSKSKYSGSIYNTRRDSWGQTNRGVKSQDSIQS